VRRVFYAGSVAAYGNSPVLPKHEGMLPQPISPYAVSKLTDEYYLSAFASVYGMETIALLYFNVFGPFQDPASQYSGVLAKFSRAVLEGAPLTIYGDGEQSRDFTYIDNVVNANLLAAGAPAAAVSGARIQPRHRDANHPEPDRKDPSRVSGVHGTGSIRSGAERRCHTFASRHTPGSQATGL